MSGAREKALNAIRWRSSHDNDGKRLAQQDRAWLLRYIDRTRLDPERFARSYYKCSGPCLAHDYHLRSARQIIAAYEDAA